MPWGDGTGPWWGQGRWRCMRPFGYGRRWPELTKEEEIKLLENEMEKIKKRLEELKK